MTRSVTLLLDCHGRIICVFTSRADAEAQRDRFNADPMLDSATPDHDAPYSVETWDVRPAAFQDRDLIFDTPVQGDATA
jgi:hypothetical protein